MTFCVLGEHCCVYDRQAKMPGYALTGRLCSGCHNRFTQDLNVLRYDYVDLSQLIPRVDGRSEVKISRPKPESSPPVNMAAFTLRSELAYVVVMAEVVVRCSVGDSLGLGLPQREGYALEQAVRYLAAHVEHLAALPPTEARWSTVEPFTELLDGPQVLLRVGRLHHRARTMCGLTPRTIAVPGLCPQCQAGCLRRNDDDPERIRCAVCSLVMTRADYLQAQRQVYSAPPAGA